MKKETKNKKQQKVAMSLKSLTKSTVWDVQESDIFRMWEGAEKDIDVRENIQRYVDIVKTAFIVDVLREEDIKVVKAKYERMGYRVGQIRINDAKITWAIKKRPIARVSDLSYENIGHISAAKLVEVLGRNFGGGWDSLSQSTQDIIESVFDISTTVLPANRLHKPGGTYEKKVADGYEVLEVPKGTWTEAIFVKLKPHVEKMRVKTTSDDFDLDDFNRPEEETPIVEPTDFDDMTEDNYRTTFEIEGEGDDETADVADFVEEE